MYLNSSDKECPYPLDTIQTAAPIEPPFVRKTKQIPKISIKNRPQNKLPLDR